VKRTLPIIALFIAMMTAASAPASGQGGQFIGVDDDPVMGSANARVTIIEFGDYQCPVCQEVAADYAIAMGVGLQGTPVFFINGRALFGTQPFATFQKIIEEELKK
jgi:protein-disulfide isomerase